MLRTTHESERTIALRAPAAHGCRSEPNADDREHHDQGSRPPAGSASGIHRAWTVHPLPTGDHREYEVFMVQPALE